MMIAAPLPVAIHSVYVVIDLATVITVTSGVAIDSGFVVLEAVVAGAAVVGLRVQWTSDGKKQAAG
jgi:hypothetical protein